MISVALDYDADADWLVVSFGEHDGLTREFALNDHIILTTDVSVSRVVSLAFTEYVRMLLVSETEFTNLRDEDPDLVQDLLYLMTIPPASRLLDVTDPEGLIARVCAPTIDSIVDDRGAEYPPW